MNGNRALVKMAACERATSLASAMEAPCELRGPLSSEAAGSFAWHALRHGGRVLRNIFSAACAEGYHGKISRRTLACCNGGVTVKNGFVFVFCLGGARGSEGASERPLTER